MGDEEAVGAIGVGLGVRIGHDGSRIRLDQARLRSAKAVKGRGIKANFDGIVIAVVW